jgi:hypothetical protein
MDILPCCYSDGLADDDVLPLSRHSPNHRQDLKHVPSIRHGSFLHTCMRECSARYLLESIVRRHLDSVSIAGQADQAGKILLRCRAIEGGQILPTDCLHTDSSVGWLFEHRMSSGCDVRQIQWVSRASSSLPRLFAGITQTLSPRRYSHQFSVRGKDARRCRCRTTA